MQPHSVLESALWATGWHLPVWMFNVGTLKQQLQGKDGKCCVFTWNTLETLLILLSRNTCVTSWAISVVQSVCVSCVFGFQTATTPSPHCWTVSMCWAAASKGLKADHWCKRVLSWLCEMYTKQKPQCFRGREDKADFCSACSIFVFLLWPQRNSSDLSILTTQSRLHLVWSLWMEECRALNQHITNCK